MKLKDKVAIESMWSELNFRFRPFFSGSVYDWCRENVWIPQNQSATPGWFSARGREYMIECLNDWADPRVTDQVLCWGAQLGKTMVILAGVTFRIYQMPSGVMWVMDSEGQAKGVSRERFQPIIEACPALSGKIPTGKDRHLWGMLSQHINGAVINLKGSNSPGGLASRPVKLVILDEIDKFAQQSDSEASAVYLAELRTKSFPDPFRFKSSTPTTNDGPIWQEFMKSDQRRFYVPCPHCSKHTVIIWQKKFTVFKLRGDESEVSWDPAAKRGNGEWDFEKVERTAHVKCCHCGGIIEDRHKTKMNRDGKWISTADYSRRGYVGRHLPSWYAPGVQTSYGALAVKFLEAKRSLDGLHGFVNSECAEPWEAQDTRTERIEIVTSDMDEIQGDKVNIMTMDFQKRAPYFWFAVRTHAKDGTLSRLIDKGSFNDEKSIYDLQKKHGVKNHYVSIDSGYQGEEEDEQFVFDLCVKNSKLIAIPNARPVYKGFIPVKGHKAGTTWDGPDKSRRSYGLKRAPMPNNPGDLFVLHFDANKFKDYLTRLRKGETKIKWEVTQVADQEYWEQMDSEFKKPIRDPKTNRLTYRWVLRSKTVGNHIWDAENHQVVMSVFHKIIKPEMPKSYKLREQN